MARPRKRRVVKTRNLTPDELGKQEGIELPDRHALSLLSNLPSLGGGGLLGGTADGTTPAPTDGTSTPPPDPSTAPTHGADTTSFAPVNKATVLNRLSSGSTEGSTSSQTTPITQST